MGSMLQKRAIDIVAGDVAVPSSGLDKSGRFV